MFRRIPTFLICLLSVIATAGGCARRTPLTAIVAGGTGPPTLVFLHGYGSSAEGWTPYTQTIRWPTPGRFVFPQGPDVMVRTDGAPAGRAWWPLDLRSHVPAGQAAPDMSDAAFAY